jgi:hypothetical protein
MDKFDPQTGGGHQGVGHDESDLSIRGIITFGILLAVGGVLAFVAMKGFLSSSLPLSLPWFEAKLFPQQPLTPAQKQLQQYREAPGQAVSGEEAANRPEAPGRPDEERRLQRTFVAPRLQYDDTREMQSFRGSEEQWLASTWKDKDGNIHIPIDQAKKILVDRGLPQVSGPFVPPTLPTAVPMVPAPVAQHK